MPASRSSIAASASGIILPAPATSLSNAAPPVPQGSTVNNSAASHAQIRLTHHTGVSCKARRAPPSSSPSSVRRMRDTVIAPVRSDSSIKYAPMPVAAKNSSATSATVLACPPVFASSSPPTHTAT